MKALLTLTVLVASLSAQASFFQEYCSSADQTVTQKMGHMDTELSVTERIYSNTGVTENKIKLAYHDDNIEINYSEEKEIFSKNESNCDPKTGHGYGTWSNAESKKLTISKKDGSLFSQNIVGVSADQKSISAYVICQTDGNSMIMCEKQ